MTEIRKSAEVKGVLAARVERTTHAVAPERSRATGDPLSETGVLRLLNACPAAGRSSVRLDAPAGIPERSLPEAAGSGRAAADAAISCPRCRNRLEAEMGICPRCRTRLETSSKVWQAVYRAASKALAVR